MSMNAESQEAVIIFYGTILESRPIDYWTGEEIKGNFITLDEFLEDLKTIESAQKLVMRINSLGGDSNVSTVIHNRLKSTQAYKTAIIDGAAMSGGTHIACAADEVWVYASSQYMIHECWTYLWGAYNASELRSELKGFDATDKAQVEIYKKRTGKSEEELLEMMQGPAFLVGQEIVDAGFADKLIDDDNQDIVFQASEVNHAMFVNGIPMPMSMQAFAKMTKATGMTNAAFMAGDKNKNEPGQSGKEEGAIMAKNLEELRVENPDLAEQLVKEAKAEAKEMQASAVESERTRISQIDAIAAMYDDEAVEEAKYGKTACSAQEFAYREAQKASKAGNGALGDLMEDFKASGAKDVPAAETPEEPIGEMTGEQKIKAGRAAVKKVQEKNE
jgi:ATP-dependent protease ClpP protease subunit